MKRSSCAAIVARHLSPEDLVVCSLGSGGRAWREQRAANLTYFASDPMGLAPSLALGLALAQPSRRVVLIEGDGDLSMNLGVLITIAGAAPANLHLVVFQNGRYETGGGQPLPGAAGISFARIAEGAGFRLAVEASDEASAEENISRMLGRPGPGLVAVRVETEPSPYAAAPRWSQVEDRAQFMRQLLETS